MKRDETSAKKEQAAEKGKLVLEMEVPSGEDLAVCEVCGHKNPKHEGMCVMCSNYLFVAGE